MTPVGWFVGRVFVVPRTYQDNSVLWVDDVLVRWAIVGGGNSPTVHASCGTNIRVSLAGRYSGDGVLRMVLGDSRDLPSKHGEGNTTTRCQVVQRMRGRYGCLRGMEVGEWTECGN